MMSVHTHQGYVRSKGRLLTIADVAVLPEELPSDPKTKFELDNGRLVSEPFRIADIPLLPRNLPSGQVEYELDNGRLVVMSPPANRHSALQTRLSTDIVKQADDKGLGETRVEVGLILWRSPDKLVGPDVAFFSKSSFPLRESSEGYVETMPVLVIEIRSKNDSLPEVRQKAADYLKAGVKNVLIVDTEANTVAWHRPDAPAVAFEEQDVLDLNDVIPGCSISLAELFRA